MAASDQTIPERPRVNEDFVGTRPIQAAHRFDVGALDAYLAVHVAGYRGPLEVEQFKGGQSNPTYRLIAGGKHYVLRRKPPGKLLPSAHAVDREYRVITALRDTGVPVPLTHCYCDDPSVIGTPFYVMDWAAGHLLRTPDRALEHAVSRLGDPDHRRDGSADRMAAGAHPGWRRDQHRSW